MAERWVALALVFVTRVSMGVLTGDPAGPIHFAAATMAATLLGLLAFRLVERGGAGPRSRRAPIDGREDAA